jgi:uncharacterized membrane protein
MQLAATNTTTGAAGAAAVLTYAATPGTNRVHVLSRGIAFGYSDTPTGGSLKIENGGVVCFGPIPITGSGAGFIPFGELESSPGAALVITLAAPGGAITGNITVLDYHAE